MTEEFPRKHSSGNGSENVYSVEARAPYQPVTVGDQIFDAKWRHVHFNDSPLLGVGVHARVTPGRVLSYLYDYAQAQALRWWLVAETERHHFSLETRLVKHRISWSYSCEAISAHVVIGSEDRSNIMPDRGKKAESPAPRQAHDNEGNSD